MKICIVSNLYLETTLPLAKYLAQNGNSVKVYAIIPIYKPNAYVIDYAGQDIKLGFNDSLTLNKIDPQLSGYMGDVEIIPFFHNGNLGKKYWKDIFVSFAIKNRLLSENYDIIHQIGTNSICLYLQLLMGKKIAIQTLHEVTAHETKTDLRSKIFLKIIGNRNKNGIIVHSQTSLNRLTDYFRNALKIKLLPQIYFVPFGLFETNLLYTTKNVEKDKNLVLFWGRITPYKGVDVLRKAFIEVTKQLPDAKLLIAGEGKTDEI
ncbi:MAG: glycosyltransferase, partial [Paludibacter sp.]|nr:glycosyltransferase [Paludibacter sp.]